MAVDRLFFVFSAALGFTGVAAGAFGAHALKNRLEPDMLAVFQTGVLYHLIHAVALAVVAVAAPRLAGTALTVSGWMFVAGVVLFSGSLYLLATTGAKVFGPITPLGGLCFLAGWASLGVAAWRA
jgi:uncharacterized membrane protein YgdD (TMEM256/DUF423 family)